MVDQINNTLLETLSDERIFYIENRNGKAWIVEAFDSYFEYELTPETFDRLIAELQAKRKEIYG